jgi:hypothetical protein
MLIGNIINNLIFINLTRYIYWPIAGFVLSLQRQLQFLPTTTGKFNSQYVTTSYGYGYV